MSIVYPKNEVNRLEELRKLKILGSKETDEFNALTIAASKIFGSTISLLSLLDDREQWFKASVGMDIKTSPRELSFCQYTILQDDIMIVPDATIDPRFADNPFVVGDPKIRFYVGCPLSLDGKHQLGTLCAIDTEPRQPSAEQLENMRLLATIAEGLLRAQHYNVLSDEAIAQLHKERSDIQREREQLQSIADLSGTGGWRLDCRSQELTWTSKTKEIHGVAENYVPTLDKALSFYPDEIRKSLEDTLEDSLRSGASWDVEVPFVKADGQPRWIRALGGVIKEDGVVSQIVGAIQDITERKTYDQSIQQFEARNRAILNSIDEGVLLIDRHGTIKSCNPPAAKYLQINHEGIVGQNVETIDVSFWNDAINKVEAPNLIAMAAKNPEAVSNRIVAISHPGARHHAWLRVNAKSFVRSGEPGEDWVVISLVDISETRRQANSLQTIFDNYPGGIAYFDSDMHLTAHNESFIKLLELPVERISRKPHFNEYIMLLAEQGEFGLGEPANMAQQAIAEIDLSVQSIDERVRPNGTVLEIRRTPMPDGGLVAAFFDVTERKRIEENLIESRKEAINKSHELAAVLASMNQGVSVFDQDNKLTLWNQQYIDIFDKPDGEVVVGITLSELIRAEQLRGQFVGDVDKHVADLLMSVRMGDTARSVLRHPSGKVIETVHAPLPDGGMVATHEDVTVRDEENKKISYAAYHDALTNLANRSQFEDRFEEAIFRVTNEREACFLMLLDLDGFKPVNDEFGHSVGDLVLIEVARRLRDCVRSADLVARFGGDEFAIILSSHNLTKESVLEISELVLTKLSQPFFFEGHRIGIGVSIGVTQVPDGDFNLGELLKQADEALYEVKRGGRNGVRFFVKK